MKLLFPIALLIFIALGCGSSPSNTNRATPTPVPTPIPEFGSLKTETDDLVAAFKKDPDAPIGDRVRSTSAALATITDAKNAKTAAGLKKKLDEIADKIAKDEALLGPMPEQSKFDASVRPVDEYLRRNLNDYSSSEFVEWSPISKFRDSTGPYWAVRLRLRATNGFGGKIVKNTYYFIRGGTVVKTKGLGAD